MRRRFLLPAFALAVILFSPTTSVGQTFHFVGAGSSAQYLDAALAADQMAINANSALYRGKNQVLHWTCGPCYYGSELGFASGARISDSWSEMWLDVGNIWIVWIQDSVGNVTDVWTALSLSSAEAVRAFSAQQVDGSGAQIQLLVSPTTGVNLIACSAGTGTSAFWPDHKCDSNLPSSVISAFGGTCNPPQCAFGPHVNVAMTDLRPEDALYANVRVLSPLDTTSWAGLGYVGPSNNVGGPIFAAMGTVGSATPAKFALAGGKDPITSIVVPPYNSIPLGAAPLLFITNNSGTTTVTNLMSGVTPGVHSSGQAYPAQELFSGVTSCSTGNRAFGGTGTGGTNLTVFLSDPLSGLMNTAEFTLFRTHGNSDASQEIGVINPGLAPYNPLALRCQGGGGQRWRLIGED